MREPARKTVVGGTVRYGKSCPGCGCFIRLVSTYCQRCAEQARRQRERDARVQA